MLVVQSSHFQIRQNILLLADNADACICVESNVSEQNICGGIVFYGFLMKYCCIGKVSR